MSDHAVRLQRLSIRRMPGIAHPGFELAPLHPQVTLIIGPNGSGKTTAGRAVEAVLGGAAAIGGGGSIGAELLLQGESWTVDLEGRSAQWMCGGQPRPAPDLASAGSAALHRIALPDLLDPAGGGHDDMAARVAQAMAGGFDLARLRSELRADERPPGVTTARRDLEKATQCLRDAQQDATRLDRRSQEELPRLDREIAAAEAAAVQVGHIETALRLARHREEAAALAAHRTAQHVSDTQLAVVLDGDADRAAKLAEDVARRRAELQELEREIESLAHAGGDGAAPQRDLPDRLRDAAERLRTLHADLDRARQQERAAIGRRDEVLVRCAESVADLPLAAQSIAEVSVPLTDLAQRSADIAAEEEVLRRLSDALGDAGALAERSAQTEALRGGIDDLTRWLRFARERATSGESAGGSTHPGARPASIVMLTGAGALGWLLLGVIAHPAWVIGMVATIVIGALLWWRMRRRSGALVPESEQSDALQRDAAQRFRARDLPQPPQWTADAVAQHLEQIVRDFAAALLSQDALRRSRELAPRRERSAQARAEIDVRRADIERALGVRLPGDSLAPAWLASIADAVRSWQRADEEAAGYRAQAAAIAEGIEVQAGAVRALLLDAGLPVEAEPAAIARAAERARSMVDAADNARKLRSDLERRAVPELKRAEAAHEEFWAQRELPAGDPGALQELVERVRAARRLDRALRDVQVRIDQDAGALAEAPATLTAKSLHELEQEHAEAAARREGYAKLIDDRARLRADIERAGSGTTIAEAYAAVDQAKAALEDLRAEEMRRAVSGAVVSHIASISRQRTMPRVFHRAIALFAQFTAGRYALEMDADRDTPTFSAHDVVDGMRKRLDQLSSGERVQLLLAVRLAFIDEEERGQSLPIVLDEVLATSDDLRAGAIMEAVLSVARSGRQVIILTAQHDERAKWRAGLDGASMSCEELDLGLLRPGVVAPAAPLPLVRQDPPRVPAPNGADHASYGRMIGAGMLDPWAAAGADAAHLWYAVDDLRCLHRCLEARMPTIGQFLTYVDQVGAVPGGADDRIVARVRAAHDGIDALLKAWRIGRTPRVAYDEVLKSDAISDTFRDRIGDLYRELGENPCALLRTLEHEQREDQRTKGFRAQSVAQLRAYFAEREWISDHDPLDPHALRLRLRAAVHRAVEDGVLDEEWVDLLMRAVPEVS